MPDVRGKAVKVIAVNDDSKDNDAVMLGGTECPTLMTQQRYEMKSFALSSSKQEGQMCHHCG